jgi:hypothetical protein
MLPNRTRSALVALGVVASMAAGCDPTSGGDDAVDPSGSEQAEPDLDTGTGADAEADDATTSDEDDTDPTGAAGDQDSDETADDDQAADDETADDGTAHAEVDAERGVQLYLTSDERGDIQDVFPVERTVPTPDVLQGALEELLAGPTAEEEAEGYTSTFSDETAGMLNSADIEDGIALVDFDADLRDALPNAGTSTGSLVLFGQLDGTVTQFATVDEAIYSLDGDVDAFYLWLQAAPPER